MSNIIALSERRARTECHLEQAEQRTSRQTAKILDLCDVRPTRRTYEIRMLNRALRALNDETCNPKEVEEWRDELEVISMYTMECDIQRICKLALKNGPDLRPGTLQ